jgi:hypothetical protein
MWDSTGTSVQDLAQSGGGIGAQQRADATREDRDREIHVLSPAQCFGVCSAQEIHLALFHGVETIGERELHPFHFDPGQVRLGCHRTREFLADRDREPRRVAGLVLVGIRPGVAEVAEPDLARGFDPLQRGGPGLGR